MADDDQWRTVVGKRGELGVARRVIKGVRRDAAFGRELDRFGH